ncbi:hypothetical protein KZ843_09580 [Pseudomonas aeruginosa]|nr:hypothetical protein [Pseudomonas aeruginosa]MBW6123135.1 hypothetical protein [Pseudomonas aeruginosa]
MKKTTWERVSMGLLYVLIVISVCGVLSYLTADGKAVIGPNPVSVEAQRADIAISGICTVLILGSLSLFSFAMSKRSQEKG